MDRWCLPPSWNPDQSSIKLKVRYRCNANLRGPNSGSCKIVKGEVDQASLLVVDPLRTNNQSPLVKILALAFIAGGFEI